MNPRDTQRQSEPKGSRLHLIAMGQLVGLSLLLVFTFLADQYNSHESIKLLAETTARSHAEKDAIYRQMFIASGGAYLTVSDEIVPEEGLAHRPDRDLKTPEGKVITLVTPKNLFKIASNRLSDHDGLRLEYAIKTIIALESGGYLG